MVANISAYRPKNKTVMHVLTITVALDMALSQAVTALAVQAMALRLAELATALRGQVTVLRGPLRVLNLATALRGQATVLRGQDSILPLQTTTSRKTTCRSSSIVTPIQICPRKPPISWTNCPTKRTARWVYLPTSLDEPLTRLELATCALRMRCSTD